MKEAKKLKKGSTVAFIAPASKVDENKMLEGKKIIESLGLKVRIYDSCYSQKHWYAGDIKQRLDDFHNSFLDKDIEAIFCVRGGAGSYQLLDKIYYFIIRENPKLFIGYSDITALHLAINKKTNLITYHAPMIQSDLSSKVNRRTKESLKKILFDEEYGEILEEKDKINIVRHGKAEGSLTGGNLSLITALSGTDYDIDTNGKILFLEEINENYESIDRMLNNLYLAGKFKRVNGVLLGYFTNCEDSNNTSIKIEEMLRFYIKRDIPIVTNIYSGHQCPNISLKLGAYSKVDTLKRSVWIK